jgi:phenylacetate-CoA ligase
MPIRDFARWIHGNLVYPGAVRLLGEGALFDRLRELRRLERSDCETVDRYQAERLAALLRYGIDHSPYYRATWPKFGLVAPDNAREMLATLPVLTKRELQDHQAELLASPAVPRVTQKITGGSTGQAVTVTKDRTATACERAAMWLGYSWRGVQIGDRVARFWGSPFATRRRLLIKASDFAMHRIRFSAFAFDQRDLERYWTQCLRFQPDYLHGYVSMLEAFAGFVADRGYDGRRLPLKSIVATSEVLTPPQRALIEGAFGAPVQIEYGCGELGPIAYECERGSLHLMTPDVVVEVLASDGQSVTHGESGEIVVTDLNNRAMPLVRYRLGDFGILGAACACGRAFPVLAKIWGRAYDFVATPDGRRFHGEFFMYLFEDLRRMSAGVQAFQVTQSGPASLDVAVVTPEPPSAEHEERIRRLLRERLPTMEVTVHRVSKIERAASGKMQVIRNDWVRRAASATVAS